MCSFGLSGCRVTPDRGPTTPGRRVSHPTPGTPNVHISGPCASNTTRKDPKREKEESKLWREEGKKERNFGRSGGLLSGGGLSNGGLSEGGSPEGSSGRVQEWGARFGFRVQFRFVGTKTETN